MIMARRSFLFGLGATIAAPALAKLAPFAGETVYASLNPSARYREIFDIIFSSMPTGEEIKSDKFREDPVKVEVQRNGSPILVWTLNPRGTFRWVAMAGAELLIQDKDVLSLVCEPCYTHTTFNLSSFTKPLRTYEPFASRAPISEAFRWRDGKVDIGEAHYYSYEDVPT